ncbi:MAG: response regulator [Desulfobacterales bacterium]|jgi:signal transduction histidine kinase|nr:response regulator [Desulfobacterales bacterium]
MKSLRLLMVDDEAVFLSTIANRLKKRNIIPETADSGEACLAMMAEQDFDVVVLDVKMPGISGLECLSQIKSKYPHTEVILLTGHASTPDGVTGIKSGAFDYLSKPVELEHLVEKIRQAYDKKQRTVEKTREAEFREKINRQLIVTERLASLGTLATGVAHEINNPLAIIQEWAGWMKSILEDAGPDFPHSKEFNTALNKIELAIGRAKRITHQLLGMVQKADDTVIEIQAADLISDVMQLVNREARNHNISIVFKSEENPSFWSDPFRLRQVLLNLVNNAIQATPNGGVITIGATLDGNDMVLQVQDTGGGIAVENLEKIFDPFFTTKPTGEGTGLGLYVSRKIIEKLGGNITVESKLGQGALFQLRLPIRPELKDEI